MKKEQLSLMVSAMLTGLFIGIMDTVILLGFNVGYRSYSGYFPSEIVNVSSIIFMVNLLLFILGLLFFVFVKSFKGGGGAFGVLMLVLTAFLTWKTFSSHPYEDSHLNSGFHGLYGGIVLVLGLSAALIPVLHNNKKFLDNVI